MISIGPKTKPIFQILFLIVLLLPFMGRRVLAQDHEPATYYVSPRGNDINDGLSESRPLKDLAGAMYRLKLGDTLIVLPGEYAVVDFRAWCKDPYKEKMFLGRDGGSAEIRTTIKGKRGGSRPRIKALKSDGSIGTIQLNGAVGVTFEYLDIWGGIGYGRHMEYRDLVVGGQGVTYGISAEHHDSLIEGCYFHDIHGGGDAIGIYISGDDNVIRNNFFRNIGHHGINSNKHGYGENSSPSERWVIENNFFTQTNGHGIGLQNTQDFVIRNNVLVNVGSQAISFGGRYFPNHRVSVTGNTIFNGDGMGTYGLLFINDVEGLVLENNLIVHRMPVAFLHPESQLTAAKLRSYTVRNNLYFNPYRAGERVFFPTNDPNDFMGVAEWREHTAGLMDGTGLEQNSIYADPKLTSSPNSASDFLSRDGSSHIDLSLTGRSPALDAGVRSERLLTDIRGVLRPQGGGVDIGAYEREAAGGDSTPPLPPPSVSVAEAGDQFVRLEWEPGSDNVNLAGYHVYRDGEKIVQVAGTSHEDQGLAPETRYSYQIASLDSAGNVGALTPPVEATTLESAVEQPVGAPPTAKFEVNYDSGDVSAPVRFDASKSADSGGIASYAWDFGDGATAQGLTVEHRYPNIGYFHVVLTVTDTDGNVATATKDIMFEQPGAVTYHVSPTGSDLNDGLSEERPLKDLSKAMYRLQMGDTLIVLPGDYEIVDFRAWCKDPWKNKMYLGPEGGSAQTRTIIKGKRGGPRPKIKVLNGNGGIGMIQLNGATGVTFEYLDIWGGIGYGRHMEYRDLVIGGQGVTYAISAEHHNALIEGCYFHDIHGGGDAIGIYISGDDNVIRNNFFRNMGHHAINSNKHGYGEKASPSERWVIENNYITETNGHGIGLQNTQDFIIRNNVLVNVGSQAISFGGGDFPDHRVTVTGNTIYNGDGKGYYGLFFINDVEGLVVENNVIVHRMPVAFLHPETQLTAAKLRSYTFRNNLYYNPYRDGERVFFPTNSPNEFYGLEGWREYTARIAGGTGLEQGSIYGSPKVVSAPRSGDDYLARDGSSHIDVRLTEASPAVNAGIASHLLPADADGNARPVGSRPDIGAYEFGGEVAGPPGDETPPAPTNLRIVGG